MMLPVRKRVGGEQHTRLATGAVALGKVAALDHKVLDDAVEARPLIAKALLARGERAEVLGRLGRGLAVEADDDAAEGLVALGDVEEDLVRDLGALDGLDRLREEEDADAEQQRGRQEEFPEVEHDGRFGGWFLAMSNWREEKIWRFRSRSMAAGERFKRDQSIAVRGQRGGFGFTHSAGEGRRRSSLRYDSRRHRESPGGGLRGSNRRTVRTGRKGERVTTTPPPPGGRVPSSRHLHCQRPFGNATRYPFGSPTNVILKLSPSHLLPQPRRTHLQRGNAPRPRAKPQRASNANNTTSILTRQLTLRRPPCPPKTPSSKSNGNPP